MIFRGVTRVDSQPREWGTGRFMSPGREEAEAQLALTDEEYNRTGSALFPPQPRSADQLLSFWDSVPIDEAVLASVCATYRAYAEKNLGDALARWNSAYDYNTKEMQSDNAHKRDVHVKTVKQARMNEFVNEHRSEHPPFISPTFAQQVIRAGQAARFAITLDDSERQKVLATPVSYGTARRTVGEIYDRFDFSYILPRAFTDPTAALYAKSALED